MTVNEIVEALGRHGITGSEYTRIVVLLANQGYEVIGYSSLLDCWRVIDVGEENIVYYVPREGVDIGRLKEEIRENGRVKRYERQYCNGR